MSQITFTCMKCGHEYRIDSLLAGKKVRCKVCKEISRIDKSLASEPAPIGQHLSTSPCREPGDQNSRNSPNVKVSGERPEFKAKRATGEGVALSGKSRIGRGMPVRVVGLVVILIVSGCALAALFSRAWTAASDLLGTSTGNTNIPVVEADLAVPDIAPDRIAIVLAHAQVLKDMSQCYSEMALGYIDMRSPKCFQRGQDKVASASAQMGTRSARRAKRSPSSTGRRKGC